MRTEKEIRKLIDDRDKLDEFIIRQGMSVHPTVRSIFRRALEGILGEE